MYYIQFKRIQIIPGFLIYLQVQILPASDNNEIQRIILSLRGFKFLSGSNTCFDFSIKN